jgi:DNA ligase-associated metallophosphoesterase
MDFPISIRDHTMFLLPEKALFLPEQNLLVIADLHIGKVTHFRKAGIPVPREAHISNLSRLSKLMFRIRPARVLFLGDLFHSDHNREWKSLSDWMAQFPHVSFELTVGNHDILPAIYYADAGVRLHPTGLLAGPFLFTHEPGSSPVDGQYIIAGHLHPGVRLTGKGKQSLRLPCFWQGSWQMVLPAFGAFTGLATITPSPDDRIYAVTDTQIFDISG